MAIRSMGRGSSEVGVDVVERDALGEHEDLQMVEQLADLLGRLVVRLVLGGHPHLGCLLDDLLADRVDPGVELRDGARPRGSRLRLLGQLRIQLLKALHGAPAYGPHVVRPDGAHVLVGSRSATTVATAADAASWPLSSADPGSPARS